MRVKPSKQVIQVGNEGDTQALRCLLLPPASHPAVGLGLRSDDNYVRISVAESLSNLLPGRAFIRLGAVRGQAFIKDRPMAIGYVDEVRIGEQRVPEFLKQSQTLLHRELGKIGNGR